MNKFFATTVLTPLILLVSTLNSGYVLADTYNIEVGLNESKSDTDMGDEGAYGILGTLYFKPIDDDFGPLAEAAFLNRASSLSIAYEDISIDSTAADIDGRRQGLSGMAVLGDRFILQAGYTEQKIDSDAFTDSDVYSVGLGLYLSDVTTLILDVQQTDLDSSSETFENFSLSLKSIIEIDDRRWMTGRGSFGISQRPGANTVINIGVAGDYYFYERLSIGASLNLLDANSGAGSTTYGIGVKFFITPRLALTTSFSTEVFLEEDESSTTVVTDVINASASEPNDQDTNIDNTDIFQVSITGRM